MKLADVHCHLESEEFAQTLDDVLNDARESGVVALVTSSVVPEQWDASRRLAGRYPQVAFALGVHPWYAKPEHMAAVETLRDAKALGAKAIGEIGLDRKIETPPFELQERVFDRQLAIACELDLPVVIHCRGAFTELLAALKRVGAPRRGGIVHSFSGNVEIAEACMAHGLSFSFGGTLTYRNSQKREAVVRRVYPDHFLLETDSPDIPPVQLRGQVNVPANIRLNLTAAAEILGVPESEAAEVTTRNAARLFGLDL